jgi:hypothetical protein
LNDLQTILDQLEDKRLDYVQARSRVNSDAQGIKEAGIAKTTFYSWGEEERNRLNDIAQRLKRETAWRAMNVFMKNAERAAEKINRLVDSRNEQVALAAARDISDRVNGKPTQKTEVTGDSDKPIVVKLVADEPS